MEEVEKMKYLGYMFTSTNSKKRAHKKPDEQDKEDNKNCMKIDEKSEN